MITYEMKSLGTDQMTWEERYTPALRGLDDEPIPHPYRRKASNSLM